MSNERPDKIITAATLNPKIRLFEMQNVLMIYVGSYSNS